jgi:hypothetical protein
MIILITENHFNGQDCLLDYKHFFETFGTMTYRIFPA